MVDFVLVLELDEAPAVSDKFSRLAAAIERVIQAQPVDQQTINQTNYTPLWGRPRGRLHRDQGRGREEGRAHAARRVDGGVAREGSQAARNE